MINITEYELRTLSPEMTVGQLIDFKQRQQEQMKIEEMEELAAAKLEYEGKCFEAIFSPVHRCLLKIDSIESNGNEPVMFGTVISFVRNASGMEIRIEEVYGRAVCAYESDHFEEISPLKFIQAKTSVENFF